MSNGHRATRLLGQLFLIAALVVCVALACGDSAEPLENLPTPTVVPSHTNVLTEPTTLTKPPTLTTAPSPTATAASERAGDAPQSESLIKLVDPLDEPEFYCVDVVGHRAGVRLDRALHAHTCKPGFEDELFLFHTPETDQLYMRAYDLCLEARDNLVYLEPCSDSAMQRFDFRDDGTLSPEGTDLCLAVQAGSGQQAGGVSHVRRDLLLTPCDTVDASLSRWTMPGPSP